MASTCMIRIIAAPSSREVRARLASVVIASDSGCAPVGLVETLTRTQLGRACARLAAFSRVTRCHGTLGRETGSSVAARDP